MRWTIGLVGYGSCIAKKDEKKSGSIRNLKGGRKVVRCEKQVIIVFNSAVNMKAVFRIQRM